MNSDWKSQLLNARSSKNLSLKQCSEKTKIPIKFLTSLEKGDLEYLPDRVYAEFHIKKYFEFLDIDPEQCLLEVKKLDSKKNSKQKNTANDRVKKKYFHFLKNSDFILPLILAFFSMVLIFILVSKIDEEEGVIVLDIELEGEILESEKPKDNYSDSFINILPPKNVIISDEDIMISSNKSIEVIQDKINIIVTGESWIIIEDKNNKNLVYELMENEQQEVLGYRPLIFKIGNPRATKILINNKIINFSKFSKKNANYSYFEIK